MVTRGDIRWVNLGDARGSAPAGSRPVLVIQSDHFNRSRISTVIVAVITSQTRTAQLPGNVFIPAAASGLPKDSVVNVSQLITLNRSEVGELAGALPGYLSREVDAGLRQVLAL